MAGWAQKWTSGLANFVPAVTYHLPEKILAPQGPPSIQPTACNTPSPERAERESRGVVVGVVDAAVDGVVRLARVPDPDGLDAQAEEAQYRDEVPKLKNGM